MEFFLPLAKDSVEAESVYTNIAEFINESVKTPCERVHSLTYKHNGRTMVATVGEDVDTYYKEPAPKVIAIFKGSPYKICTRDRGVARGEPILVGEAFTLSVGMFS